MVDGPEGGPPKPEEQQERDYFTAEERALQQAESERAFQISRFEQNILNRTPRREAVRWATREVMGRKESVTIASPSLEDRYGMLNIYQGMRSRAAALRVGTDTELVDYLGFREDGIAVHRFKPLEVDQEKGRVERQAEAKRLLGEHEELNDEEAAQRDALIAELERAADELEVREKFDDLWSLYLFVQGDLREFRRIPFAAENKQPVAKDFKTVFTLPATAEKGAESDIEIKGTAKIEWGDIPEAHKERMEGKLGERIDLGMRLYTIVALSERPKEFVQIRNTPGYRDFVIKPLREVMLKFGDKLTNEQLEDTPATREIQRLIEQYENDEDVLNDPDRLVEKVFIGDIDKWRTKDEREGTIEIKGKGAESDAERNKNRGLLTMHGNFFARKERWGQKEEINEAVKTILGGDKSAQELARRMFYLVGEASYYGAERDKIKRDEQGNFVSQDIEREGAPFSDARERVMDLDAFMYYKQAANEWAGPDIALGKYPKRLLTSFFRHVSVSNPELNEKANDPNLTDKEREKIEWEKYLSTRSVHELMWEGWDGETALRLGDVPWENLKSYAWKDYSIRLVFSANLFDVLTGNTEERDAWNLRNFQSVKWWREYATAARVSLGNWTVTKGLNRKWFEENMEEIESRSRDIPRDDEVTTDEGAKKKAASELLTKQTKDGITKTHEVLADAIHWWYGNIEAAPEEKQGWINVVQERISKRRTLAGILLPGEEEVKFQPLVRKTKKKYG